MAQLAREGQGANFIRMPEQRFFARNADLRLRVEGAAPGSPGWLRRLGHRAAYSVVDLILGRSEPG